METFLISESHNFFKRYFYYCVPVCDGFDDVCASVHIDIRGQFCGIAFLLPPLHGFQESCLFAKCLYMLIHFDSP